jgi:hypothetical protein
MIGWGTTATATTVIGLGIVVLAALHHAPQAALPDPALTPGALASHSAAEVCGPGYAHTHRVWGPHEKYTITLPRYGIPARDGHLFEDDDLIPVCAGGDNADPRNHWPQPWAAARIKDEEEAHYCRAVCAGSVSLDQAQDHFRHWGR